MHIDARNLDNNTIIEGDICIVGAGAAGISIALEMMNTSQKVILLEGGGFEYEDRIQELYSGKKTGQNYYPLKSSELHYFGGSTGHWGGMCSIFDPIAFQKRHWVNLSGWPITQDDLLPYYKRAHVNLDIDGYDFDASNWQKKDPTLIPLPFDDSVVWNKVWRFSPPTRFGQKYKDTIVHAKNIHLFTYANVTDISTCENITAVRSVTVKNYTGKTHTVKAKYFVLACAGIQNARVLLAANKQSPKGLGNKNDLVGRYFMEHLEIKSAELWLKNKNDLKFYMYNYPIVQGELAITPQKQEEYEILNGIVSFTPLEIARKTPPFIEIWSNEDPRENEKQAEAINKRDPEDVITRIKNKLNRNKKEYQAFELTIRLEQAPNPLSRISLSTDLDELGVPRAALNWEFTSLEKKSILKIYEIIGQQAGAFGIGRVKLRDDILDGDVKSVPPSTSGGWHHMGTTRMNNDPNLGVVDENCKIHGIDNLFLAGSSCFPTGAGVNPTLTIVAMAIKLADHLKSKFKNK
jgi:choline dehydrogenase-like flavoprotein